MCLRKASYPAHISYLQPYELEIKFSSSEKLYDVFSPRNSFIDHLCDEFKTHACAESPCYFKNSAETEVDPCVGVEKHTTKIRY